MYRDGKEMDLGSLYFCAFRLGAPQSRKNKEQISFMREPLLRVLRKRLTGESAGGSLRLNLNELSDIDPRMRS